VRPSLHRCRRQGRPSASFPDPAEIHPSPTAWPWQDYQVRLQRLGEGELENYDGDTRAAAKFSNSYLDKLLAA
jgi:hypothetical protein